MKIIPLGDDVEPLLDPDLVWNGIVGDLAVTSLADPVNPGGLRSGQALATAVLICLMTDRRVEQTELRDGDVNRGWPGDSFDLANGDVALGSKLWLLRRRAIEPGLEVIAEDYAREALQTLIDQGAVARFDVVAVADRPAARLDLHVSAFAVDGSRTFDRRFAVLWEQIDGISDPLA
ncbi:phage GP46 family protein [Mesorhizobium sp. CAU 1732]|uniref:phage GP46 family protein n=1 Tax=Mesorhizobium sp. CAU 1732 TaxID=3140358 RepID=UPI003260A625